ncbi:hypothetical protein ACIBSV_15085 [Embleya sp. NPDC050154]|uniref:hypothetical protein n=1 Tax=Embleya sp. NPDC050154 TaxID=3363988 RepID=UPI00378C35D7
MALSETEAKPYTDELSSIYDSSSYSAQAYFEAAKSAEFWGRIIVFAPALVAAISGSIVALGGSSLWGISGAVSGGVAATATFMGSAQKTPMYLTSARRYTQLRHGVRLAKRTALDFATVNELSLAVQDFNRQQNEIIDQDLPIPNRLYARASRRISTGILTDSTTTPSPPV